jgi:uncharacterized membrane protein
MSNYLFESDYVGFYENGIDLLRNKYVYCTIDYRDITKIVLQSGHLVKNWVTLLILGLFLILSAIWIIMPSMISFMQTKDFSVFLFWRGSKAYGVLVVLFLIAFGVYCILFAFKFSLIIKVFVNGKVKHFSLENIVKDKRLGNFTTFIRNCGVKEVIINLL